MKAKLKGFEPVDYISKKTGLPVKGCTLKLDVKSKSVFGYDSKEEYVAADTPIYKRVIEPLLDMFYDEDSAVYGADVVLDYNVTKRGGNTYSELVDLEITPKAGK